MAEFWSTLSHWWIAYGMIFRVILIVIGAVIVRWLLILLLKRTVNRVVSGVKKSHDVEFTAELSQSPELAARMIQRTRTLGTVGGNIITWTIVLAAFVMVLDQLGVSVAAIVASAGIVAAGLAFGAQNIVKDLLNGLFMVFEDQIGVGDIITVGTMTGTVEDVGIRVTQVRDLEGTLWFVRNGEILQLGNHSHGWGRAIVDVEVTTEHSYDDVAKALTELSREVVYRPGLSRKVLEMPELLGLESVYADRATYRLLVKTRPGSQWEIAREIRHAISDRFDDEIIRLAPENPRREWFQ